MAYNTSSRFLPPEKPYALLDPGSYQHDLVRKIRTNKCPFNSCTPRITLSKKSYTEAVYDSSTVHKIPNVTSLMSKVPRFPHEDFKIEDFEAMLCDCEKECDCNVSETQVQEEQVICQGKIPRRLIIGRPPKLKDSRSESDTSVKSNANKGGPPFYDVRVHESTEQYHGWKWSQWTAKRYPGTLEQKPGPADYSLDRKPTAEELCLIQLRSCRRRDSRQMRFMDMVLQKNLKEHIPSPAHYSPNLPGFKLTTSKVSKTPRFAKTQSLETRPGPGDHNIIRLFSPPQCAPTKLSRFRPPAPPFFGIKALRFKPIKEEGPSPASYGTDYKRCRILRCSAAPFGTSALRWKETPNLQQDKYDYCEEETKDKETGPEINCTNPQWMFKSNTKRFKLIKRLPNGYGQEDVPKTDLKKSREPYLQYLAPFNSSEGKFQPWRDWLPYHGSTNTPGIGYYNPVKAQCIPAVVIGPLSRAPRFQRVISYNPAPNEYDMSSNKLKTFNKKLQNNIDSRIQYKYNPPQAKKRLTPEEKIKLLLEQSIKICDTEADAELLRENYVRVRQVRESKIVGSSDNVKETCKIECLKDCNVVSQNKLLRSFLYKQQIPNV